MVQNKTIEPVIACTLTETELANRKQDIRQNLLTQLKENNELANGYQLVFANKTEIKEDIALFIAAEQQCCSFLNFELSNESNQLVLDITGPEGTKEFIAKVML